MCLELNIQIIKEIFSYSFHHYKLNWKPNSLNYFLRNLVTID